MIASFSSSVGYAYQLLFIVYHGKLLLFSVTVFLAYSICLLSKGYVVLGISCLPWQYDSHVSSNFILFYSNAIFILNQKPLIYNFQAILLNSTCVKLDRLVVVFYCSALVFTSLLFFFRTRGIFKTYPWVIAFFACLWLAVLGGCLAFIVDIFEPEPEPNPTSELNTTQICINSGINPFVAAAMIISLINDTLVFMAISWRLSRNSYESYGTLQRGIRFLIFGDYLPVFSRVLLKDGQAYYLLALFLDSSNCLLLLQSSLQIVSLFSQDHRYHEYHSGDHVILSFKL